MTDASDGAERSEQRVLGVRLRKFIDVVVEDRLASMLLRGAIADISETGMRVIVDQYMPKGSKYTFTMKRNPFLELRGEVRWIRPFARETFQVGVLFVDVDPERKSRLANFLELERKRSAPTNG